MEPVELSASSRDDVHQSTYASAAATVFLRCLPDYMPTLLETNACATLTSDNLSY